MHKDGKNRTIDLLLVDLRSYFSIVVSINLDMG
jgi:hypothetical protein